MPVQIEDALNGDYYELYVVENRGETEEERLLIANTLAGFNISTDHETYEVNPSTGAIIQQEHGKPTQEGEMSGAYTAGNDILKDLELLDEDGNFMYSSVIPDAECWVYPEAPQGTTADIEPSSIIEMPDFKPATDEFDLAAGDTGETNIEFFVNGRLRFPLAVGEAVPE